MSLGLRFKSGTSLMIEMYILYTTSVQKKKTYVQEDETKGNNDQDGAHLSYMGGSTQQQIRSCQSIMAGGPAASDECERKNLRILDPFNIDES